MRSPDSMGEDYQSQFDRLYVDLAEQHDLIFMPFLLKDVALEAQYLLRDFKHPNALGVKVIADNLYPYLIKGIVAQQNNN
jgi:acyl-CoA thioesterase-1